MSKRTCKKCGLTKPVSEFYPRQCYECKECSKKRIKENRAANLEYYREFDRQRNNLPHRVEARKSYAETDQGKEARRRACAAYLQRSPEKRKESVRKWVETNPEKRNAHNAVLLALYYGTLIHKPCESCCATPTQAHHDDYSRPLDVRWLCASCHAAHHKTERQRRLSMTASVQWKAIPTHKFETEGEFYGEWFKILVEYQYDLDDLTLVKIEAYRDEQVSYGPDGQYRPHIQRHAADITPLLTESQRLELTREINDALAQAE